MTLATNERILQFFSAMMILFLGWLMTTITDQVTNNQDQIHVIGERVSALEVEIKQCEAKK